MFRLQRPFLPPNPIKISEEEFDKIISEDGTVDMGNIDQLITIHERELPRYHYLDAMYKGFHSVLTGEDKPDWKPDVRMAINFPKLLTRSFSGYGYGVPIKVSSDDDKFSDSIAEFEKKNNIKSHDKKMVKLCCKFGHAWEFFYQNAESQTRVKALTPDYCFCVYQDTMEEHALLGIRYGYHIDWKTGTPGKRYGEILLPDKIVPFDDKTTGEPIDNPYGLIPLVEWIFDDDRTGLYEDVCGAVELFDHTLCEKGNDVDALAEAYLVILGAEVDENGVQRIRDNRIINFFGTDDANQVITQFLSKPTADGTQENLLDRLADVIFMIAMVCNFSDDTFGNATSGVSLAYKVFNMSNLANDFDLNIEASIRKRYKIFCSLGTNSSSQDAFEDIEIKTTRNLPKNLLEEAQTAQQLRDIVSRETQLKVLSIVDDPKKEIEAMDEEDAEKADSILNSVMFNKQKKTTDEVTTDEDQSEES